MAPRLALGRDTHFAPPPPHRILPAPQRVNGPTPRRRIAAISTHPRVQRKLLLLGAGAVLRTVANSALVAFTAIPTACFTTHGFLLVLVDSVPWKCRRRCQEYPSSPWLMEKEKVRRLLVLNREKRLVGIVSLGDLAAQGKARRRCAHVGTTRECATDGVVTNRAARAAGFDSRNVVYPDPLGEKKLSNVA
jgi:hypothetical protein